MPTTRPTSRRGSTGCGRRRKSRGWTPASSIVRETLRGWLTGRCCCSTTGRSLARWHGCEARACARRWRRGATFSRSRRREIADLVRQDPLGLYDLFSEQLGGTQAGVNLGVTEGGYVTCGLSQPDGHRASCPSAVRRRVLPGADGHASSATRPAPVPRGRSATDETLPPLRVELAGGHRIAVETESVVRRESIWNTVGSLALILPLLFLVFRSLWLVVVRPAPLRARRSSSVLGILGLGGATLSAAATASAAMLFGLGVDGVVLLYVAHALAVATAAAPKRSTGWPGRPRACSWACGRRRRPFTG